MNGRWQPGCEGGEGRERRGTPAESGPGTEWDSGAWRPEVRRGRAYDPPMAAERDWAAWHEAYDDPASPLAQRLTVVRARIADALSAAPPGPVRLIAMCAGDGRDVIPVLAGHPRGREVSARLVELDPEGSSCSGCPQPG